MDLYLLRHGQAGNRLDWDGPDSERPLTESGRDGMARIASAIAKLGLHVDAIVTSPYARSRQTADILAEHLHLRDRVVRDERLAPGFDAQALADLLEEMPDHKGLVLVGHEPDLTSIVEGLTGARAVLKKGGMAYVRSKDPGLRKAELYWLLQPTVLGI